ncbi:MAG: ADP-ribosylglycohydrolase family protein [Sporichthyaceae bacterium]
MTTVDRALGAFYGLAVGDALGMPTQMLPRNVVRDLFGEMPWFAPGPEVNEISAGLTAGRVTDDTDQAVIVARTLIDGGGEIDLTVLAERLLDWEREMAAAGSLDLLGPSTKRALAAVSAGTAPRLSGRAGDTNGAAMRITPVGIATPARPLDRLVEAVAAASRLTHDTTVAISGAAAVAAAVSAGVDGADVAAAIPLAQAAAEIGAGHGHYVPGASIADRIGWAVGLVAGRSDEEALDEIDRLVGTGVATQEAVPAAFAIASLAPVDPWRACRLAARLGGDSDTVAAMAGAVVGACCGLSALPADAVRLVREVNDLHLEPVVDGLLALRSKASHD